MDKPKKPHGNSIEAVGLKRYLNDTRDQHNGFGYSHFHKMLSLPKPPGVDNLARIFGVTKQTMLKWRKIWREERG